MKPSAALLVLLAVCWLARAASTRDGVYSEGQATRGQAAYKVACASCHGAELAGSRPATPALAGPDFTSDWAGQTVDDLFERIQGTMPGDHPGTLSRDQTADIVAYILKFNKLPAGKNDLPTAAEALKGIQFEAAK